MASEGYYIIMWTVWDLFVWDQEMELVQYIDRLSLKEEEQTSSHFSSMMQAININQQYNSNKLYCCHAAEIGTYKETVPKYYQDVVEPSKTGRNFWFGWIVSSIDLDAMGKHMLSAYWRMQHQ